MVSLDQIRASNALLANSLPPHLVAVFVGATSGIGEGTVKRFAKLTRKPKIYFIGRTQSKGDAILEEMKTLNPDGEYIFLKYDVSLIANVDEVCRRIRVEEKFINLLFMSCGTLDFRSGMRPTFLPP
jgi:short-subunit dehydrogenase